MTIPPVREGREALLVKQCLYPTEPKQLVTPSRNTGVPLCCVRSTQRAPSLRLNDCVASGLTAKKAGFRGSMFRAK